MPIGSVSYTHLDVYKRQHTHVKNVLKICTSLPKIAFAHCKLHHRLPQGALSNMFLEMALSLERLLLSACWFIVIYYFPWKASNLVFSVEVISLYCLAVFPKLWNNFCNRFDEPDMRTWSSSDKFWLFKLKPLLICFCHKWVASSRYKLNKTDNREHFCHNPRFAVFLCHSRCC